MSCEEMLLTTIPPGIILETGNPLFPIQIRLVTRVRSFQDYSRGGNSNKVILSSAALVSGKDSPTQCGISSEENHDHIRFTPRKKRADGPLLILFHE